MAGWPDPVLRDLLASSRGLKVIIYEVGEIILRIKDERTKSSKFKELSQVKQLVSGRAGIGTLPS